MIASNRRNCQGKTSSPGLLPKGQISAQKIHSVDFVDNIAYEPCFGESLNMSSTVEVDDRGSAQNQCGV